MGIKGFFTLQLPLSPISEESEKDESEDSKYLEKSENSETSEKSKKKDKKTILKVDSIGELVTLKDLKGVSIAIDASNMIYEAILALSFISSMTDAEKKTTSHINIILYKVLMYKKAGIKQTWVFDSPKPSKLKQMHELKKRTERKKSAKTEKGQFKMTSEHINDIKKLLRYLGIPYFQAPDGFEAEQYAAKLSSGPEEKRFCRYTMSGDSDVLLFGGNMLRQMKVGGKKVYKVFEHKKVLKTLDLNKDQFIDLGLCLGTDFAPKVTGVGPKTAIQKVKDGKIKLNKQQKKAKKYIKSAVPMSKKDLHQSKFNRAKLIKWLIKKGFNKEKITKSIDAVYK